MKLLGRRVASISSRSGKPRLRTIGSGRARVSLNREGQGVRRVTGSLNQSGIIFRPEGGARQPRTIGTPEGMIDFMREILEKHKVNYTERGLNGMPSRLYMNPKIHVDLMRGVWHFIFPGSMLKPSMMDAFDRMNPKPFIADMGREDAVKNFRSAAERLEKIQAASKAIHARTPLTALAAATAKGLTKSEILNSVTVAAFNNIATYYSVRLELLQHKLKGA